jgi:cysteine-rich repeat protein
LYWVLVPSLLLVISVFGVNFISRPTIGQPAPQCSVANDCNVLDQNPCRQFQCVNSFCQPAGINLLGNSLCGQCGQCGNGVCDPSLGEDQTCAGVGKDCLGPATLVICASTSPCSGSTRNFCCPGNQCSGDPLSGTSFDIDCACCGDSLPGNLPGEQCDPSGSACNGGVGTCDTQCQCTPNPFCGDGVQNQPTEQCDDGNTVSGDGCSSTCQTEVIPICGDGVVTPPEQCEPNQGCSVTDNDGDAVPGICNNLCQCVPNCVVEGSGCGDNDEEPICNATGGATTGGTSLIPPPVHPTVLAQWLAAFAVPGAVFTGLRLRRRSRK